MTANPTQLSAEQARATDQAILAALDLPGDAALSTADLAAATGRPESTVRRRVAKLRDRGLVVRHGGERSPVRLTSDGRAQAGAVGAGAALAPELGAVLELLPGEAYRAMVRLMLAAVVARYHLRGRLPGALWPSFVAIGETGTGKTLLARVVCRLLGLDELGHIVQVPRATRGDLLGRREQIPGGSWRLEPPALLGEPFICLDEYDKGEREAQAAALTLAQGNAAELVDGQRLDIAPAVYATSNATYAGLRRAMGDAYVGRSIVLDARGVPTDLLADVDLAAEKLLAPGALPRLRLAELAPPADELPAELRAWLREALKGEPTPGVRLLTDLGRGLVRVEALTLLPLGLATLYPATIDALTRVAMATWQVLLDALTVASTVDGFTADRWAECCAPVREHLRRTADETGAAPAVGLPDLAAGIAERQARGEQARRRRVARDVHSDELVARRAFLASMYGQARDALDGRRTTAWPAARKTKADALRAVLARLRDHAAAAKSGQALDDIETRGAGVLAEVDQLLAAAEHERRELAAARQREQAGRRELAAQARHDKAVTADNRRAVAAARAEQTRQARQIIAELRKLRARKTTRNEENVPAELVARHVVWHQAVPVTETLPPFPGHRLLARALGHDDPQPRTRTETRTVYVDLAGRRWRPRDLAAWTSPGAQAALDAALTQCESYARPGQPDATPQALPAGAMVL